MFYILINQAHKLRLKIKTIDVIRSLITNLKLGILNYEYYRKCNLQTKSKTAVSRILLILG